MHRIEPSRRLRRDDCSHRRQHYEHGDAYSLAPIQAVTRRHADESTLRYHAAPRYVGQQLPDFVLFPPVRHSTGGKATRLSADDSMENFWGNDTVVTGVPQMLPPISPTRQRGRRTSGTHDRTLKLSERGTQERVPAAKDSLKSQEQWNSKHPTKSRYNLPSPPDAPRIPRLSTPDFDDIVQNERIHHGDGFCACCPTEEDASLSRWRESRVKMDKQSKSNHLVIGPVYSLQVYLSLHLLT